MIQRKDIDARFVKQIETSFKDIEALKEIVETLDRNDGIIEKAVQEQINEMITETEGSLGKVVETLNQVIESHNTDGKKTVEDFEKLYTFLELQEKKINESIKKVEKKIDDFLKQFWSIDGYYKQEGGQLKGMDLPEDRLFADKFRTETVTERIIEQPIYQEIEKKVTPTLSKSDLEHYFDYGVKLSENVMVPKFIKGYDKLQVFKEPETFYKSKNNIILFRFIKTLLLILLDDGTAEITNTVKNSVIFKGNIIEDIRNQLSLEISPLEITTIHPSGPGLYIATKNNGVLFYNIINKTLSNKMEENDVVYIEEQDDKILLISKSVTIYNKENLRLYNSKIFELRNLKPIKVEKLSNGKIVVLTKGDQKGLDDLIYLFEFVNGEVLQKFIYTDPFDTRDTYYYNITSDQNTMTVIGNKDGNYSSATYNINKMDERYKVVTLEKEAGLKSIEYDNVGSDYLLVYHDKVVLNSKVVYGIDPSEDRTVIFKDSYAYLVEGNTVERLDVTVEDGSVFKFRVDNLGDGMEVKLIVKTDSKEVPVIRVAGKGLKTYTILDYIIVTGTSPGDVVEVHMNNSVIEDISSYYEYTITLD